MAQSRKSIGLSKTDRILRALEQEIVSGKIVNGERLSSEMQLMERFSVSRNTIRKGLDELARQGLITKRSGVGSFVTYDGRIVDDSPGWSHALALDDEQYETRVTAIRRGSCSRTRRFIEQSRAKVPSHADDYLRVDRIRRDHAFGKGLSIERSRLPWREPYQQILDQGLTENSLSKSLSTLDIAIVSGKEWASVVPELSEGDAEVLQRDPGDPMLQLQRITYSASGELIEFMDALLDPERFALHLSF